MTPMRHPPPWRLTTLVFGLLASGPVSAGELDYSLGVDLPITLASGGLWAGLYLADLPATPTAAQHAPGGLDGLSPFAQVEGPAVVSDVLLYGTLLGSAAVTTALAGDGDRGIAFGVWTQTFTLTASVTEVVKRAVDRPRPYVYGGELTGDADDFQSFYSGHTSLVGAGSFAMARSLDVLRAPSVAGRVALYGSAAALTAGVGAARVLAGRHFVSDVLVGGVVGASMGFVVPELHRRSDLAVNLGSYGDGAYVALSGSIP